jgi:NADH-quinone oxidoreductase subunit G
LQKTGAATAVLTGGRLTNEDALAYAGFAHNVLGTKDVDFRARAASDEETSFLAHHVAGTGLGVTYADLEAAPSVLLVGFEPEDESPIVFLRLRKAALKGGTKVYAIAPFLTAGLAKMKGTLIAASPAEEVNAIVGAAGYVQDAGSIVLVGERAAQTPGLLTAVSALVTSTGAKLAWVPRRAGERGALDAGLLPVDGRNTTDIINALGQDIKGLLVAGVGVDDVAADIVAGAERAEFVVSLETRHTDLTAVADVVLPVAVVTEKSGTFRNWEGRDRSFNTVVPTPGALSDAEVLGEIASAMGEFFGVDPLFWNSAAKPASGISEPASESVGQGQALLSTWRHLLDSGTLQEGEPYLAATARMAVVRVSPATASKLNLVDGATATVSAKGRTASAPVIVTVGMAEDTVWIPANSEGSALGLASGTVVNVSGGAA